MALQGYIIGISENTGTSPASFWAGVGTAQTADIDAAEFIEAVSAARLAAGTLQTQIPESHVEAYLVNKTIDYVAPIGSAGI